MRPILLVCFQIKLVSHQYEVALCILLFGASRTLMKILAVLRVFDSEKVEHGEMTSRGIRLFYRLRHSKLFSKTRPSACCNITITVNKLSVWLYFLLCSLMDRG